MSRNRDAWKSSTEMIFKRHEVQVAHTQRKNMEAGCELAFSPFPSMNTNLSLLGVKRKFSFGQIIYPFYSGYFISDTGHYQRQDSSDKLYLWVILVTSACLRHCVSVLLGVRHTRKYYFHVLWDIMQHLSMSKKYKESSRDAFVNVS